MSQNQMSRDQFEQEDDRGYREWSEVQQKLELAAQEEATRLAAQAEPMLRMLDHFILRVFK